MELEYFQIINLGTETTFSFSLMKVQHYFIESIINCHTQTWLQETAYSVNLVTEFITFHTDLM